MNRSNPKAPQPPVDEQQKAARRAELLAEVEGREKRERLFQEIRQTEEAKGIDPTYNLYALQRAYEGVPEIDNGAAPPLGAKLDRAFAQAAAEIATSKDLGQYMYVRQYHNGKIDPYAHGYEDVYTRTVDLLVTMYDAPRRQPLWRSKGLVRNAP